MRAATLVCAGCLATAPVSAADTAATPARAPDPAFSVEMPAGTGPHPAVIAVAGCGGFRAGSYTKTLAAVREAGFATLELDYPDSHDHAGCQASTRQALTPSVVADDIGAAVEHLRGRRVIDASAVNLLGWSYGGGAILQYLAQSSPGAVGPVAAVSLYYPDCAEVPMWRVPVPVLVLHGADDTVAPIETCRALFSGEAAEIIETQTFPGAYHGFDLSNLPAKKRFAFGILGYQRKAAEAAKARLLEFLRR